MTRGLSRLLTRHALLLVSGGLACVLIVSAALRFGSANRAAAAIALAEGDRLAEHVAERLRGLPESGQEAALARLVEEEPGLVYAGILDPNTRQVLIEAGEPPPRVRPNPRGMPRFIGELAMIEVGIHPPHVPPPPPDAPPPARLLFDPGEARPVLLAGATDLTIGIVGGLFLLVLAGGVWLVDRRREQAELAAAEQAHLASLGEMSAVLAHEIRNPLAALKGHAQLLEERLRGESGHASAQRVVKGAVRLERLVVDLLQFARSEALESRACDPVEVAHDALSRVAPERIELFADDAPDRFPLDPARIGQVLDNLLRNAVQVSPDGAQVDLTVASGAARSLRFVVRDRGPGVPEELRERLFQPFVTTKTRGTGLGLAIAFRLVELHGGTLTVDEAPGGGARFVVDIPEA